MPDVLPAHANNTQQSYEPAVTFAIAQINDFGVKLFILL